ncbi:hypothetical protein ACFFHH_05565 [Cytobacillus solani]|nr:hypothetical protein [Cytobacillus solani]USK53021.1 hypothetical protein LIS82_15490 [Cytobacillus solani]
MNQQPLHYDGRFQRDSKNNHELQKEIPFELTEEMRTSIGQNPYSVNSED